MQVTVGRGDSSPVERVGRRQRALVAAGTVALFAFHLWSTRHVTGPSVVFDESGYLGSARWLAGGARWDMPTSPAYAIGYPVLLAPVMAAFHAADDQWRAVMVLNAALLASLFPWLVHVFGRVVGARRNVAMLAAGVGALVPCVVAAGASAIAENLVLPLVAATVAATWAMTASGRPRRAGASSAFGPLVALLLVVHPRFTLVAALGLGALVIGARLGIVARSIAVVNGVLLVSVVGAGTVLDRVVRAARWDDVENLQGGPRDWLRLAGRPSGWGEVFLTAVGQVWYLAAGSLGLSLIGIWFLVGRTTRAVDRSADATATDGTAKGTISVDAERDRRFTFGFLLASAGAVFITSVSFFAQNQFRADHWVYGRHNDSFTPLWVGVAVIALAGAPGLRRRVAWLAGAAVVVVVTGVVVWATRDPAEMDNQFSVFAVPALSRMIDLDSGSVFGLATAVAVLALVVMAVLAAATDRSTERRGTRSMAVFAVPVLLALFFAWTGSGSVAGTETFRNYLTADWSTPHELERLGVTALEVEGRTGRSLPTLLYPFALPDVDVTMYDAQHREPTGTFVVARVDDPGRRRAGDRLVLLDQNVLYSFWDVAEGLGIWVRPGPEQDRLAAAGLLLPAGFPAPLPATSRSVDLAVTGGLDDDGLLRMAAGSEARVQVTGHHSGTGSPWPDGGSARAGRVQVVAHVEPDDADRPSGIGSSGELDRWVRPGDRFTAEVVIRSIGPLFAELAPGLYTVQLGVGQSDVDDGEWFASGGPDGSFRLEIT